MANYLGNVLGLAAMFFVLLAIVLGIGKLGRLQRHPLRVYVVAVAAVWLLAASAHLGAPSPTGAYLVTLAAIAIYRHETKRPLTGWFRVSAVLTAAWCAAGLLSLSVSALTHDSAPSPLDTWLFALAGLLLWAIGWLFHVTGAHAAV